MWQIILLKKLPKEFSRPHKEPNLLIYTDFQILISVDMKGQVTGSIRTGINVDDSQEGLITDLWVNELRMQGVALRGYYARLLKEAESSLRKLGVKKVDAYYLDGPGRLSYYYSCGYVLQRRTVEIEWELSTKNVSKASTNVVKRKMKNDKVKIKKFREKDKTELVELLLDAHQSYWSPWSKTRLPRFRDVFVAYKGKQAVGMADEGLEIGVVVRKGFGGEGLGSVLLNHVFRALKKKGKKKAITLATSGLDDYDPQIYLYTMNGGKIVREYVNLQKAL